MSPNTVPTTAADFDRAYRAPITFWGDVRVPEEVKSLVKRAGTRSVLELGCGVGRFSRWVAQQGIRATGVDFSRVAIEKAKARVMNDVSKPEFLVGDVTRLDGLEGPVDASFDVGCFHCLGRDGQQGYVAGIARLLRAGGTHLLWALDDAPSGQALSPEVIREAFATSFTLERAEKSRRRLIASHWYWLARKAA